MSSRPRPSSQLPRAPVSLSPDSVIDTHATLTGSLPITVSASAVLHPRCRILSTFTPVTIGPGCIVHSRAVVGISSPSPSNSTTDDLDQISIGANVVVESGAIVAGTEIGERSVIGANAEVREGAVLGRNCKVGPGCVIGEGEVLQEGTVVYGMGQRRVQRGAARVDDLRKGAHEKQLETLRKLIKSDLAKHGGAVQQQAPVGEQGGGAVAV